MGNRHKSREHALQLLYSIDISKGSTDSIPAYWGIENVEDLEVISFAERLVRGVVENLEKIDSIIGESSENWKISRMEVVDRNILRMAVFEFLWCEDVPVKVTLNEAIEIAKQFGTENSRVFVNGILDRIAKTVKKDIDNQ